MGFRPMPSMGIPDDETVPDDEAQARLSAGDATLLVLAAEYPEQRVVDALRFAVAALAHDAFTMLALEDTPDVYEAVLSIDPWSVVAIDDASVAALKDGFGESARQFVADHPVTAQGYDLVAVPGFAECLDDRHAKRVAWERLKAAHHPESPL